MDYKLACGCSIWISEYDGKVTPHYCPLHESAPDLYEACELVDAFFKRGNPQGITGMEMKVITAKALAKAKGIPDNQDEQELDERRLALLSK